MDLEKGPSISIRPASTVILAGEQDGELRVYLLRRSLGSGFFPGYYVFPGGALNRDDQDCEFWRQQVDLPAEALRKAFGSGLDMAGIVAHGVAAIRETFEEAGVFS